MFQVASHASTSFNAHGHATHLSARPSTYRPISAGPAVQLPRTLTRPQFVEISRDALLAASPELAGVDVPPEYIRRGLRQTAPSMLSGLSALIPCIPSSVSKAQVPPSFAIPYAPSHNTVYPSHVLAVTSSKSPTNDALMLPVHAVVLASHCASLPCLPRSGHSSQVLKLPVLPLALPSPAAFTILHSYMYTHRLDAVLKGLFPVPKGFLETLSHETVQSTLSSGSALHQLSSYLSSASSNNLQVLMGHAAHVKELWQDMVALGIHVPELWDTLDLAWEVVLGSLNLAATA